MNHKPDYEDFYRDVLRRLNRREIPYLIGGGQMMKQYSAVRRDTNDLDLCLRRRDFPRALDALSSAGYATQVCFTHWLGKACSGDRVVDIIFSSGNGICEIDDEWFEHATDGEAFGTPVKFCPVEEMIWSKAFIMERERYDGSDIAHLIIAYGAHLDWQRLLRRFKPHWRVLFSHLVLFGFVYPASARSYRNG